MNILGIIAEYNPFHKGHQLQIEYAKKEAKADYIIAVISASFVQRGEPAIYASDVRTKMALSSGIDAVFEIPAPFSTASARDFAGYGIRLFHNLGIHSICFGMEHKNLDLAKTIAKNLLSESQAFQTDLKAFIAQGNSYPKARQLSYLKNFSTDADAYDTTLLLENPNNILGIEYLRNIYEIGASIQPYIILRQGSGYHESEVKHGIASATAIRKMIRNQQYDILRDIVPEHIYPIISEHKPMFADFFCGDIHRLLLRLENPQIYADINDDLARRLKKDIRYYSSYEEMIQNLRSKSHTYTKISRDISHILLNIMESDMQMYKKELGFAPYARLLGFKKESAKLLHILKQQSRIPIITKPADYTKILNRSEQKLFEAEVFADRLYHSMYMEKYSQERKNIFERGIVIE